MSIVRRLGASVLATSMLASFSGVLPTSASVLARASAHQPAARYELQLPNGQKAVVFSNGIAQVFTKDHRQVETQIVQPGPRYDDPRLRSAVPDKARVIAQLSTDTKHAFASNRVIVVYRQGTRATRAVMNVDKPTLRTLREAVAKRTLATAQLPQYTNDFAVNRALASIGVDRSEQLFRAFNPSVLAAMRQRASNNGSLLDFANAYRLHVSAASVRQAVLALAKLPQVAYVAPDWTVSPMHVPTIPVDRAATEAARTHATQMASSFERVMKPNALPSNYALTASAQSFLNAPGVDAAAAFDEIDTRFHQLPGQGETITNVSLGDLDDASAKSNSSDPCFPYVSAYGPTTIIQGGQRYLDLPSMPLIPTYTADTSGNLSGTGEVCDVDPYLGEIGLDFTTMAPLPHNLQRPGEQGSGQTDLLGIAPGASYRLVVPASSAPTISEVDTALLAAALQAPHPNVITTSIGFGQDQEGFPSRYLEEDPLSEAIIAAIVQSYDIVVCVAANDGTRTFTTVAIGPSGGSAATNVVSSGHPVTSLGDDAYSTTPSEVYDSGSIDAGGTTTDDIFANPPQYATSGEVAAQHAYAETRWTGFTTFSSGFGSRVNVSAPADNILSLEHCPSFTTGCTGDPDSVEVVLQGGTSASAPETAAAAAVALQVAQLTNHPFQSVASLRRFLEQTGSQVGAVSQADTNLAIGSQIDVRAIVEALLSSGHGPHPTPSVARVAVEQRRDYADLNGAFLSDTDPTNIDLANGVRPGSDQLSWLTIAPDWEFIPEHARYALVVDGGKSHQQPLATTPWARLLPQTILQAAGLSMTSTSSQTAKLVYEAMTGNHVIAKIDFSLTFGPPIAKPYFLLAPKVPPVVTGSSIPLNYDVSNVSSLNNPQIIVSEPGRVDPDTGQLFHPAFTMPLPASPSKGTVQIPVSKLQGGGIYGIGIELDSVNGIYSNFAFTRVATPKSNRPAAPLLSSGGSTPGHYLQIPYAGSFQVRYDVSNVPGASGAELEISAAGPGAWGSWNPFNNPNGTIKDNNGVDAGSVYDVPVSGTSGTATISNAQTAGLYPTLDHVVRVIPTRGGVAVGEGSDVSSVSMDGILALDGGDVNNGWGVDSSSSDGFITSGQRTAAGQIITSLETFDQKSNLITQNVASGSNSLYYTNGWGIYGGDIGLFCDENETTFASTCNLLNTVASGTIGSAWNPSSYPSTFFIDEAAANNANDVGAFYGYDPSTSQYSLFSSNITAGTFSPLFNIMGPLSSFTSPQYWGLGENTSTNTAVLAADDVANPNGPPTIVTVNVTNGQTSSFTGLGTLFPYGVGVDSGTNIAAVPTLGDGGLTFYNLATQKGTEVIMPQPPNCCSSALYPIADQTAQEFLIEQATAPNFGTNNNSLSRVLVYDESGNLKETLERFDLYNTFISIQTNNLQINPATRAGYLIGPFQQQLAPFKY